jgi:hypothetical protein
MKLSIALRHWRLPRLRIKFLVVSNDNMTVVRKSKMIVTVLRPFMWNTQILYSNMPILGICILVIQHKE